MSAYTCPACGAVDHLVWTFADGLRCTLCGHVEATLSLTPARCPSVSLDGGSCQLERGHAGRHRAEGPEFSMVWGSSSAVVGPLLPHERSDTGRRRMTLIRPGAISFTRRAR